MASPNSPPSPSTSFYAMSDDEEGEYNTIMHTRTGRGVKLLYSKSKVCGRRVYQRLGSQSSHSGLHLRGPTQHRRRRVG